MSIIAWIVIGLMLAGALGLLLAWGPLSPTHRHRDSDGGYDSGTQVLVRTEKASTSTRTGSRYRTSTAPARVGRRYETKRTNRDAFPGYGG
jgi:hypothetical protein